MIHENGKVTPTDCAAWTAYNEAFFAPMPEAYRAVGKALYGQEIHEEIVRLFERSDAQNELLDHVTQKELEAMVVFPGEQSKWLKGTGE